MAQIDSFIKRKLSECESNYLEDYYDLYDFITNSDLRKLFAIYHTQINKWFSEINGRISQKYDEDGSVYYAGGYLHAQDSRDYLALLENIDNLRSKLSSSKYAFLLRNDAYDDFIRRTRRFVVKSGGSTIPEGVEPVDIVDLEPIFELKESITVNHINQKILANLNLIGEGSYATVFSYKDPTYDIPIALKRAKKNLDNKEIKRFKQEFEVLKQLKSPYVVDVYSYDSSNNEYTMELLDESIYKYINRENTKLSLRILLRKYVEDLNICTIRIYYIGILA